MAILIANLTLMAEFDVKPRVKTLIESHLKEMQSTKVIMKLGVQQKNPVKPAIKLDPEDIKGPENLECTREVQRKF